ncbi:hypothetical protein HK105_200912 [Polyrhizophydium stewartii]|uniref:IMS import disulfide relay-system CHCH-CHCH-like Cx9C domain-containing protein n=1 Tax=Polyrhizophydium stewartii TaxID=2732419 RepID=A0ABR4NIB2_9FUNG
MEDTLDLVSKHCGLQIRFFSACIDRNPNNWQTECLREKAQVTKCAQDNVAELKRVKEVCGGAIAAYRACLEANPGDPKTCVAQLRELYECHQTVAKTFTPPPGSPASV